MMKRIFDVFAGVILLLVGLPLLFITAVIVKLRIGSPVIFKQIRTGYNGVPFTIYKFRTMSNAYDARGALLDDDARQTNIGRVLRRLSLDEMPQLFNVLKGDMSIVGPRPLVVQYMVLYNQYQKRRHEVKPGITGWVQVNGRNDLTWPEKFEFDVWYVDNHSLKLDVKIIFMTMMKMFKNEGIYAKDGKMMEYFKGN